MRVPGNRECFYNYNSALAWAFGRTPSIHSLHAAVLSIYCWKVGGGHIGTCPLCPPPFLCLWYIAHRRQTVKYDYTVWVPNAITWFTYSTWARCVYGNKQTKYSWFTRLYMEASCNFPCARFVSIEGISVSCYNHKALCEDIHVRLATRDCDVIGIFYI